MSEVCRAELRQGFIRDGIEKRCNRPPHDPGTPHAWSDGTWEAYWSDRPDGATTIHFMRRIVVEAPPL